MKTYLPMLAGAFLLTLLQSAAVQARSLSVDGTMTCNLVTKAVGSSLSVAFAGTEKGNKGTSGFNLPVLTCHTPSSNNRLTALPIVAGKTHLYTWIDLSVSGGTPADYLATGLSTFNSSNAAIVAMVDVIPLSGAHAGDTQIILNFQSFPESACSNVLQPVAPSFTWFGKTYVFTGQSGAVTPCDANATNDFLFGPNGVLLGYNSASDTTSGVYTLEPGLPPGWSLAE